MALAYVEDRFVAAVRLDIDRLAGHWPLFERVVVPGCAPDFISRTAKTDAATYSPMLPDVAGRSMSWAIAGLLRPSCGSGRPALEVGHPWNDVVP
jgi:hypothetical protein